MGWVTPEEEAVIRRLYNDTSLLNDEIASDLDMNEAEFLDACEDIGLPRRSNPRVYVPTPADIRTACAEIRHNWSSTEREERLRAAWPDLGTTRT